MRAGGCADTSTVKVAARTSWIPFAAAVALVVVVDLTTKALAVDDPMRFGHGLLYNPELPSHPVRLGVCIATILVVAAMAKFAARRNAGPILFTWLAAGLLVGGVIGNWSSGVIWALGVPDFIGRGLRMWNLADFAIGFGLMLFLLSAVGYSIRAFLRRA